MTPYDGFGAWYQDPADYQQLGALAPEPVDSEADEREWNGPQGGEHRIECEMREEREDG